MNIITSTTSLACAALVLLSLFWNGNYGVDASVSFNDVVTCLADAPTICVGTSVGQGPSPAYDEATNTTTYIGGWKFTYDFMEGLETYNGTEFGKITDDDVLAEANATTLEVSVTIDDDGSCVIDVGSDETCVSCSTELCGFDDIWPNGDSFLPLSVTFDCTNVVNGRASLPEVCESVELSDGVFYPLVASMSKEEDTDAAALDGVVVDSSTSTSSTSTSSNGDASTSTSTTSSSTSTTAASSTSTTSTCGLLPAGTFPQDGIECSTAMPAGQTTIGCEMSRSFTTDAVDSPVTQMDESCTCDLKDPTWKCSTSTMSKEDDTDASAVDGLVIDDGTSSNGDASTSSSTTSTSATAASSTSTSTCGLLEAGTFPQDGIDCAEAMPAGEVTIWCEMSRSFTSDAVDSTLTEMDKSCTCDLSNPKWKCSTSTHDSTSSSMSKEDNNDESATVDVLVVDDSSSSSSTNVDASSSSTTTTTSTTSTCGLLPVGTLPEKDADCSAALPEGTATIWCEDLSYAGAGDTQTDTSCTCDRTNPIWSCTATDAALAPNQPCPPADTPKATGNSCVGQLSQPNSSMTCMWSRSQPVSSTSDAMMVSTISCECKRDADGIMERNEVWVCDGTIPPMPIVSASKENNDKDLDSIADVGGTMAAATGTSSSSRSTRSAAVHYFAVMAVGIVGAVAAVTTL